MPPEPHADHLARALLRLGATHRVKAAPVVHAARWHPDTVAMSGHMERLLIAYGKHHPQTLNLEAAAEQVRSILANPAVCPYTADLEREDQDTAATRPLRLDWSVQNGHLHLADPAHATQVLLEHFHPIAWPAFQSAGLWPLLLEVVPACWSAAPTEAVYRQDRWLYDGHAQQAAETLTDRLTRQPDLLHAPVPVTDQQAEILAEYLARLERGTNPRRWVQDTLKRSPKQRRKTQERTPHA